MTSDSERLAEFISGVAGKNIQVARHVGKLPPPRPPERVDALFHMPLLALAVMVIVRRREVKTFEVGRRVAWLMCEHFSALREQQTSLAWSITLRRRCAEALIFLEGSRLADADVKGDRSVRLTESGKKVLTKVMKDDTDLGQLLRGLTRAEERVVQQRGIR